MAIAKRDQNRVTIGMGVDVIDTVTPLYLKVDPVTGYLLVDLLPVAGGGEIVNPMKRDEDRISVGAGVSSVDGTTVIPLHVDHINNRLSVDIL